MWTCTDCTLQGKVLRFTLELEPRPQRQALLRVPGCSEKVPFALRACVFWGGGDLRLIALPFRRAEAALPDLVPTVGCGWFPEEQPERARGVCRRVLLLPEDRFSDPEGAGGVLVQEDI